MADFKETKDYTFAKLCKSFNKFEIPNFQRPYSWKLKQLQEFFKSILENEKEYFLGNVVAIYNDPLKIIDGQQRLTTISLLLAAIRDLYLEIQCKNEQEKQIVDQREKSINTYLFYEDLDIIPAKVDTRLNLGKEKYQSVYKKIIDKKTNDVNLKNLGDNEKRIISNYVVLKKLVSDYISNSKLDRLEEVLEKTISLQLILIGCSDDNDIYRIFEGFNSTGLGLSVADLIKNSVLMQSSNDTEVQNSIETIWLEMENLFETTSIGKFPKFLRYQYISENGYVSMSNLFEIIKNNQIKNKTPKDVFNYVLRLNNEAGIFIGMIYEKYQKNLDLDDALLDDFKKFRLLRNDQVYEILLSYYKAYKAGKIKKSTLQGYLRKIWIFVLRSRFVSINPSEYEKIFANHCENISMTKDSGEFSKQFDIFIDKLKKLVSDDEQFVENFISDVYYDSDSKLVKEVILEIMRNENKSIKMNSPEIEHILPQDPKKWGLTKTEIREHIHRLGNLTLLFEGDNKDAANDGFDKKSKIYNKTGFKFNSDIDSLWGEKFRSDWKVAITERSIDIAKSISNIWKL